MLLCSCTAWRSLEAVAELERRTGKPVVTSNQASIWAAYRAHRPQAEDHRLRPPAGEPRGLVSWGAQKWPPIPPKRSSRPGGAVALLDNLSD